MPVTLRDVGKQVFHADDLGKKELLGVLDAVSGTLATVNNDREILSFRSQDLVVGQKPDAQIEKAQFNGKMRGTTSRHLPL
jgi:hypothetical protein